MSGTLPHVKDHIAMGVSDFFRIPCSAVKREHEAIIPTAADARAAIIVRGGAVKERCRRESSEDRNGSDGWQRNLMTCLVA